jgi:hypothetical protein
VEIWILAPAKVLLTVEVTVPIEKLLFPPGGLFMVTDRGQLSAKSFCPSGTFIQDKWIVHGSGSMLCFHSLHFQTISSKGRKAQVINKSDRTISFSPP